MSWPSLRMKNYYKMIQGRCHLGGPVYMNSAKQFRRTDLSYKKMQYIWVMHFQVLIFQTLVTFPNLGEMLWSFKEFDAALLCKRYSVK